MATKYNPLTPEETRVIENEGTEAPFSGEYDQFFEPGTFICRKCNAPLFSSQAKFEAGCGWPAFDANFPGAVTRKMAAGEQWAEIECANCGGHLGHVFEGEQFTAQDTRHCVNSLSIRFIKEGQSLPPIIHAKKI